jgi:SAM-dependent methyltransferase
LAELGISVVGGDLTPAMVDIARQREAVPFVVAAAEALPVRDRSVALVTVGSGLHWFDTSRFFAETARVLVPSGALLVYEHAGVGLAGDAGFSAWTADVYLHRYPSPPTPGPWLSAVDAPHALAKVARESWADTVEFSHEELVAYLLTQGNVSNPIDAQEVSLEEARQWLLDETAAFFARSLKRGYSFLVKADLFVASSQH